MVTKGTVPGVLAVCSSAETADGAIVDIASVRERISRRFEEYGRDGYRTLGIAFKRVDSGSRLGKESEAGMTFSGFLVLFDPPKPGIAETFGLLRERLELLRSSEHRRSER
jgi:Mg2+-importing ATPase